VDYLQLAENRLQWRGLVNTIIYLKSSITVGNVLTMTCKGIPCMKPHHNESNDIQRNLRGWNIKSKGNLM